LQVCKITFGAEPKDGELYEFLLRNWNSLQFSRRQKRCGIGVKHRPKRMQRKLQNSRQQASAQNAAGA
jgi:hypothetical protein